MPQYLSSAAVLMGTLRVKYTEESGEFQILEILFPSIES